MKDRLTDYFIYAGILYAITFYLLKGLGVINTPLLLEYSPQIFAGLSIFVLIYKLCVFIETLRNLPELVKKNRTLIKENRTLITRNGHKIDKIEKRLIIVETHLL